MSRMVRWAVVALPLIGAVLSAAAQGATAPDGGAQQPPRTGFTIKAHAREVVTDVTVIDRRGNPVHGLQQSAFQIFDNGKPQRLASFDENTSAAMTPLVSDKAANVYSNDILLHPPAVFNVILLDTATIGVVDQMYLRQELDKFIQALPPTEPLAIFMRGSEHTIMVANFTSDHQRLLDAVHNAIPRLRQPGYRYQTDIPLMEEIGAYLVQYPGRKNVLWFTGGSNLLLRADPDSLSGYVDLRPVYDVLERARIALYPIDARGLTISRVGIAEQHMLMEDEADATGGQAVINTNGLAHAAEHIADTDPSFYTLTYSPQDVKLDNKWHKVKVKVDGADYQLSYRRGYYDDGSNLKQTDTPGRQHLLQGGDAVPDVHIEPIIFQVTVNPADSTSAGQANVVRSSPKPPGKNERTYSLHYSLPPDEFPEKPTGDQNEFSLGLGVLGFNQYGRPIARVVDKVTLGVSREHLENAAPNARLGFDQVINLPDGEDFLYVAVWNMESGRVGVVQIPLAVQKAHLH